MELAPVLLFTYKRLDSLKQTVNALQSNFLAADTDLFIFSDGPKKESDSEKVELVRDYLQSINGFKNITIKKAEVNKGLANSIISGVTEILQSHKSCIVLEDDLVTSRNFLDFMNQSLEWYESHEKVFTITGFTFPFKPPADYTFDVFFNLRSCSWSWGIWADRWKQIDWQMLKNNKHSSVSDTKVLGTDFPSLVKKFREGSIDSWAVPWSYYQYKVNKFTMNPIVSKVKNIGFDNDATHTFKSEERFATELDTTLARTFTFTDEITLNKSLNKQFARKFSYYERLKWRLRYDVKKLLGI